MTANAAEIVPAAIGGKSFRASRRTVAHLEWTVERLAAEYPRCSLRVIQGCYSTGVAASAGTHDRDACLDVEIVGMAWTESQVWLRQHGWAAWWRRPPTFSNHVHMVSIGYPGGPAAVGIYVPAQVDDYHRHALGLKGQHNSGSDRSWFPPDIDSTVFDYDTWNEAHMPLNKDDLAAVRAEAKAALLEVLNEASIDVGGGKKWSLITVARSTYNKVKALK